MRTTTALALLALLAAPAARAGEKTAAAQQLERLKSLAGTWTGKAAHPGSAGDHDATVTYRVTSGGNAVLETINPGTAHEMVTLYHLDGKDLVLTHYCAAGNQPTMRMKSGDEKSIGFDFVRGTNMKPGDMHMHSAAIAFAGEDQIVSEWTSWQGGKPAGTMRVTLARQK